MEYCIKKNGNSLSHSIVRFNSRDASLSVNVADRIEFKNDRNDNKKGCNPTQKSVRETEIYSLNYKN